MKFILFSFKLIVLVLCLSPIYFSTKLTIGNSNKPIDFKKTKGFRCFEETGLETAIRLNGDNEVECWSENGKECVWGLNSEKACLERVDVKNVLKLNPLTCGITHKKIHGTNGYDVKNHWCEKGLKFYFGKYHCPSFTGLKEAIKMDKTNGEIRCLSKDLTTCYTGKDIQQVCEGVNECKKKKDERKKSSFMELVIRKAKADPMKPSSDKNKLESIGCEQDTIDQTGHTGYQTNGKHWCKEALAYFRYTGDWLLNSKTGLFNIVRMGENGDVECLSKDGSSCLEERGGDIKMKDQIDSATNGGKDKPKVIKCGAQAPKGTTGFEDKTKMCYKAYYSVLGKTVPPKSKAQRKKKAKKDPKKKKDNKKNDKKKDDKKKDKKDDKKDDKKEDKVDPKVDIPWRETVFGPKKDGLADSDKKDEGHVWRAKDLKDAPEDKKDGDKKDGDKKDGDKKDGDKKDGDKKDGDKKDGDKKKDNKEKEKEKGPGWRGEAESAIGTVPPKDPPIVPGLTWRNLEYKKFNKTPPPKKPVPASPGSKPAPKPRVATNNTPAKPATPAQPKPGQNKKAEPVFYEIISNLSKKCVEVQKGAKNSGAAVVQSTCNQTNSQKWQEEKLPDGNVILKAVHSKLALSVDKDGKNDGDKLVQLPYKKLKTQEFKIAKSSDGSVALQTPGGKCMDIESGSKNDGAKVIQWKCNEGVPQKFTLKLASKDAPPAIEQKPKKDKKNTKLKKAPHSKEVYEIKSALSGLCMGLREDNKKLGTLMVQLPCKHKKTQRFEISQSPKKTLYMRVQSTGLALSIWGGGVHDLANVVQNNFMSGKHQEFTLKKHGNGNYEIKVMNSGKCLHLESSSKSQNTNILQMECTGKTDQQWKFVKISGNQKQDDLLTPDVALKDKKKAAEPASKPKAKDDLCVTMFLDINYKGEQKKICGDVPNFKEVGWNDKASSVKIPKGIQVEFFWDTKYGGKKITLTDNTPSFVALGWNDKASSAKVTKAPDNGCVTMYQDINYKGRSKKVCGEVANFVPLGWNDQTSSVKIPKGVVVEFFEDINFKGKKLTLKADHPNFVKLGWNDKASSAKATKQVDPTAGKPEPPKLPPAGVYKIVNVSSEKCLDISGASKNENARAIQSNCHGGLNQQFQISYNKDGSGYITSMNSKKLLSTLRASKDNGDKIAQKTDKKLISQKFEFKNKDGIYIIINMNSKKCLDVSGGNSNGAAIQQWACGNTLSQKWKLQKIADKPKPIPIKKPVMPPKVSKPPVSNKITPGPEKKNKNGPKKPTKNVPSPKSKKPLPKPATKPAAKPASKPAAKPAAATPPKTPPTVNLYRYYSAPGNDHFYTTNAGEIGTTTPGTKGKYNYVSEGFIGKCYPKKEEKAVPLYRYWNGGISDHFYTTNAAEIGTTKPGTKGKYGYVSEGIACWVYGNSNDIQGLIPINRYWHGQGHDHFYTTNIAEIGTNKPGAVGKYGYKSEGIMGYLIK